MDVSPVLISKMQVRFPVHRFVVADAAALPFENATFDAVVEKGSLDAIFFSGLEVAHRSVLEFHRVLRPGGVMLSITAYGGAGQEGPFLGAAPWQEQLHRALPDSIAAEGYVCTKAGGSYKQERSVRVIEPEL